MAGKEPFITFTDDSCLIQGVPYSGIPLLINSNKQILEPPSDWLRYLTVTKRRSKASVRQFAYHLKYWWSYLNRVGLAWDAVDDFVMLRWRDECLQQGLDEMVVNGYVSTVFRMYLWAERNGHTKGLIGEADLERNIHPALSVEVKIDRYGIQSYSSPFLIRTSAKPVLPVPTNEEITKVHEALEEIYKANAELMIRDALILTWMEQTGIRRAEALSLKRSHIPEWDEIWRLEETGEKTAISVIGKRNKKRSVWAGSDLLSQTRLYIEEERRNIVSTFRKRLGSSYREPQEIFLSSRTGFVLHPDSISQRFAKAFRKAGVKGSGHRVRARLLTNLVEKTFECEFEKFGSVPDLTSSLLPVAQIAGHSDVKTLQFYLAGYKKRLLQQTSAGRAAAAEERALSAERRLESIQLKLKGIQILKELAEAIKSGKRERIIDAMRRLEMEVVLE
jgi:integrase